MLDPSVQHKVSEVRELLESLHEGQKMVACKLPQCACKARGAVRE